MIYRQLRHLLCLATLAISMPMLGGAADLPGGIEEPKKASLARLFHALFASADFRYIE